MLDIDLCILIPITEEKTYALDNLFACLERLTLPPRTLIMWHINRSKPDFAEELRARYKRLPIASIHACDFTDFSGVCGHVRQQNGQVLDDSGAVARMLAIVKSREALRVAALEANCSRFLWLDADMLPPPDLVTRLMHHELDVVAGRCHIRRADQTRIAAWRYNPELPRDRRGNIIITPFAIATEGSLIWRKDLPNAEALSIAYIPNEWTGLQQVSGLGLAATLMTRPAMEAIQFVVQQVTSDDAEACRQLQDAGFPIYMDLDLPVGHLDEDGTVF